MSCVSTDGREQTSVALCGHVQPSDKNSCKAVAAAAAFVEPG